VGLNPSLRRVEETGITIASFLAYRKFLFAIPVILFVNNSILDVAIKKPAHQERETNLWRGGRYRTTISP
jgi:hypothetical protein